MKTKAKAFDCVEMKNRIQAERLAEFTARSDEFSSYLDFINARIGECPLAKIVSAKVAASDAAEEKQ